MKTVEFRAKAKSSDKWVFGNFTHLKRVKINPNSFRIQSLEDGSLELIDISTLGHFFGLIDKFGKKVFTGDILIDFETNEEDVDISGYYPVVYNPAKCEYCVDNSFKKDGSHLVNIVGFFGIENIEVVGNIFDNAELLRKNDVGCF